jgi:Flp pilus assembly protein CpaB
MVGQVHTGDHVDVYVGFDERGRLAPVVRLLMSDVPVLKAGSEASSGGLAGGGAQSQQTNVTLNVTETQAGPLAFSADNGKLWLVLRPANTSSMAPSSIVTVQSLLLGSTAIPNGGKP